jgi:hypothetical protein
VEYCPDGCTNGWALLAVQKYVHLHVWLVEKMVDTLVDYLVVQKVVNSVDWKDLLMVEQLVVMMVEMLGD